MREKDGRLNFLTTHELEKIRNEHNSGLQLTRLSIDRLFNELDIAKEDVRGIELKIDATYAMNGALKDEIKALNAKIDGYKMKYENTGSMFGRREQEATIEENRKFKEALVVAYSHCADDEMDETIDVIRMALEGNDIGEIFESDLAKGYKKLEDNK